MLEESEEENEIEKIPAKGQVCQRINISRKFQLLVNEIMTA